MSERPRRQGSPRGRRHAGESLPRPRRAFGPVAGTVVALGAWAAVAHNSGSGWVQALGALMAGFLLVGLVAPLFAVRWARCAVLAVPADAVAGDQVTLVLSASRPVVVRPLYPPGPETATGGRSPCPVPLAPTQRGVHTACVLQVASAAPFGLMWWTKRVTLDLPRPLHVAPRPGDPDRVQVAAERTPGDGGTWVDRRIGESRGVRPYRPGDLRHWVHWPATAHAGTLMVREMEGPAARPVTVRAVLPDDPDAAEEWAARALGTVAELLAAGRAVDLVTVEATGQVTAPVGSVAQAGHRLASALPHRVPPARPRPPRRGAGRPPAGGGDPQ